MGKYLQLRLAQLIARLVPRRVAYGLARRVADLYWLLDRRGRENVCSNLRHIFEHSNVQMSPRALRSLARETFLNFAKYLVDFFHFLHVRPERLKRLVDLGDVEAVLQQLLAHRKGVILLSAHLGNWELGAAALAQRGYKVNAVTLSHPNRHLNDLYQRQRLARGIHPIPTGHAARECIAALQHNEIVAVLADRDFTTARRTVQFFGAPARLPSGPAKLALATGAPILPSFLVRVAGDTFRAVRLEPIWVDRTRDTVDDVMRRIAAALEQVIRDYSEQWFQFHDLWDIEADRALASSVAFGKPQTQSSGNE